MPSNMAKNSIQEYISLKGADDFQQFYNRNLMTVFRFIYGLYGGPIEEVEDLTAETFLRAWKSRHQFLGSESAGLGWLLKIARNLIIDAHRCQKRRGYPEDIEKHIVQSNLQNPEQQVMTQEQIRTLWSLLNTLSDLQREILVLRYLLGWRVQDIGNHLGVKENTVSVYISRAIKRIRREWPG
jgi:RNA polymerase sigma-70 factor (ECF subfamily)